VTPYYADDLVTIYHGDCRELLEELADVDAIVTDPPYGISYRHSGSRALPKGRLTRPRELGVEGIRGDEQPFDPRFLVDLAPEVIIWGANHFAHLLPASPGWLVWDKLDGVAPSSFSDCELAWQKTGTSVRMFRYLWRGICQAGEKGLKLHPSQKPLSLMRWCVGKTSGTVADPFMGSGSTLVAAKSLNRRSIGIEIEERYCEIAARRCSQEVLGLDAA
jgi:site-specific DNA-methyltransferase (adenine-specific)